jgi:hypothetical protein
MQMNVDDLNSVSATLLEIGARRIILLKEDSDKTHFSGVYLFACKEADPV